MDFCSILGRFWRPKINKKRYQNEKGDFLKMSVSLTRELNFGGSRDPKSIQKALKRELKNQCIFWLKKSLKINSKRLPRGTPNCSKIRQQNNQKNSQKNEWKKSVLGARGGRVDFRARVPTPLKLPPRLRKRSALQRTALRARFP